ncbi:UNVERIFIED_CONTAM: hypothetical protein HDU68_003289 [Siphonaria sp. JEL0065]|nr:hypothetical protein HDU68_003289 [Siphonaria sp. JEL0065]
MQRTIEKLTNLETRFLRLNEDGQDCLQSITNWTISRARSTGSLGWSNHNDDSLTDWQETLSTPSAKTYKDIESSRTSLLSILKLMGGIVNEMNSVLASFVKDYSLQDIQTLARVES